MMKQKKKSISQCMAKRFTTATDMGPSMKRKALTLIIVKTRASCHD